MSEIKKHLYASSIVFTIGSSFMLNEVLTNIGTFVIL